MAYYTYYSLEVQKVKNITDYNNLVDTLRANELLDGDVFDVCAYHHDEQTAYFNAYGRCKWYNHSFDMVNISRQFPDMVFKLCGDGEESEDMWHEYFHNGTTEECHAQIIFPKPKYIKWQT